MAEQYAVIEFEEYPDEWYRVRLSPVPLDDYETVVDAYREAGEVGLLPAELRAMVGLFVPFLESWSRDDKVTVKALGKLDANLLYALVGQWINGVRRVPLPLPKRSSDGEPSEGRSLPSSPAPSSATTS